MQRKKVLSLLILAFAGFVLSYEAPENGSEVREVEDLFDSYGGRKLLQEKAKTKVGKQKAKEGEAVKVSGLGEKKPKETKAPKETVQKAGGKSGKEKRLLDEEEDEDITFLQEESATAKENVSDRKEDTKASMKASTKKPKKASKKNEDSADEVQKPDDGKMEEPQISTTTGDKAKTKRSPSSKRRENESGKTPSKQKKQKNAVHVEDDEKEKGDSFNSLEEQTSEPVEVEIIPDDEADTVDQKVEETGEDKDVDKEHINGSEEEHGTKLEKPSAKSNDMKDREPKKTDTREKVKKGKEEVKKEEESVKKATFPPAKKGQSQVGKTNSTKAKDKQKPEKQDNKAKSDAEKVKKSNTPKKTTGAVRKDDMLNTEKKEQIPIKFSEGVAHDVEDLHTDAGLLKPGVESVGELDDEEDVDFIDEMTKLPSKIQETAGHVADTLRPGIQRLSEKSKTYFTTANQQMTESFTPIVGEQVAPVMASLLTYALLLMPLFAAVYMFERIRAKLSLAKVLFFSNVYLGMYFVTLVLAAFALHSEPMAFVFKNSHSSCVLLQLLQALGYLVYLLLYTIMFLKSCSNGGVLDRLAAGFQWIIVALFGLHYYVTVFHRAMAMKVPRTTWKVYLVYSSAFAVLALFARAKIEPSKKEYYYSTDDPDEAVPVDKRS